MSLDHEQRRRDIAEITIDLIAREGLEAATIRRIAAEAGFSTTAITHYFVDKQELLVWAFQHLSWQGEQRFEEVLQRDPSDILGALLTMVPWCPSNIRRWRAYLAFWDESARNAEIAALIAQGTVSGQQSLHKLLVPRARPGTDLEKSVQLLNAILQGRALQILVSPKAWNRERIADALREAVDVALR